MPELPEVETVKNGLLKKIKNKKITNCKVLYNGIIAYPTPKEFIKNIENQTIQDIKRRGKFLIFHLDDYYLISHLRMEGKYFIKEPEEVTITLEEEKAFNDLKGAAIFAQNFGLKVNLKTWVKVKEDWLDSDNIVKKFKFN